ncbi:MAG TPA: EthD family reductase [Acetobacteraceae bacterium]
MIVSVLYPAKSGSRFDLDYYMQKHIPKVKARWSSLGLRGVEVLRCTGAPSGTGAYQVIALLTFGSLAEFQEAAKQHGKEVIGDIPNFTDVEALMQFNDTLG